MVACGGNNGIGLERATLQVLHKGPQLVSGVVVRVQVQQQGVGGRLTLPQTHVTRHALVILRQVVGRVVGAGQHKHKNRLVGWLRSQALCQVLKHIAVPYPPDTQIGVWVLRFECVGVHHLVKTLHS